MSKAPTPLDSTRNGLAPLLSTALGERGLQPLRVRRDLGNEVVEIKAGPQTLELKSLPKRLPLRIRAQ
eukprot:5610289-Pyramimonas_sp.AAC.1